MYITYINKIYLYINVVFKCAVYITIGYRYLHHIYYLNVYVYQYSSALTIYAYNIIHMN